MKIITCNLPLQYIEIIDKLTGTDRMYPSRSELIRVAVHEYLVKELQSISQFAKLQKIRSENEVIPPKITNYGEMTKIEKLFKTLNL